MPIDQFPTFPAVEEQQQYGCERYEPRIRQVSDPLTAQKVGEPKDCSYKSHDYAGSQEPHRCSRPHPSACYPVGNIGSKCCNQKNDRERNNHRVNGMSRNLCGASMVSHGSLQCTQPPNTPKNKTAPPLVPPTKSDRDGTRMN